MSGWGQEEETNQNNAEVNDWDAKSTESNKNAS